MKSDIAVLGIAVAAAFAGLSALGLTTNEWQAVNGVWDGNWSDKDHWSQGVVPSADEAVLFQAAARTSYTVTVNDDYSVAVFELLGMDKGDDMTTTFKGSGSISADGDVVTHAYRALTLDGVDLSSDGTFSIYKDVIATNGASVQAVVFSSYAGSLYLYDGCSFKVTDVCKPHAPFNVYVYEGATAEVHEITRYSKNYIYPCYFHIEGGDVTVDMMRLWSAYSGATLNAGSFTLGNIDATSSGNSGVFDFQGGTATLGAIPPAPVLPSDTFKIGPKAMVEIKIPVGANYLLCKEGGLPATAKIVAVVPEGLAPAGYMVLRGWRDDTLPAALRESVTLEGAVEGAADGWSLNTDAGGHVVAWKRGTVGASGTATCYEWTGAASENFADPNNWTDGDGVAPAYPNDSTLNICFGASDVSTVGSEAGFTVNNFTFLNTAVNSFNFYATNSVNAGGVTLYGYYLTSQSALPQHVFTTIRTRNASVGAYANGPGALFVTPPGKGGQAYPFYGGKTQKTSITPEIRGDVRLGGRTGSDGVEGIALREKSGTAPFTRLTVVKGASLTYANSATTGFAVTDASIDVEQDATLTYANTQRPYQWTAKPSDFRINGTFDIQAPFVGGFDQTYGGSGVLKTAEIRPDALGNTALNLQDTLVLEPSQDWVTASDAAPANTMRLSVAGGNPSIRLSNDWTYGPVEGTQTEWVDRSFALSYGTTLTVDAGGHRATFKDYLTGRGMLIVTNGTVKLDYDEVVTRTNIRVCNTGVLEWTSANTFASLTVQPGGVLHPLAAVPLTFPSTQGAATATLTGSALDIDRALLPATGWLTILRAEKGITGLPTLTDAGLVCRVRTVDGYAELQVKEKTGAILLIR